MNSQLDVTAYFSSTWGAPSVCVCVTSSYFLIPGVHCVAMREEFRGRAQQQQQQQLSALRLKSDMFMCLKANQLRNCERLERHETRSSSDQLVDSFPPKPQKEKQRFEM